jgi:hypothetical protein
MPTDNRRRDRCPEGHPTPTKAFRDAQGYCLKCRAINRKAQVRREREAIRLVRALEMVSAEQLAEMIKAL